MDLTQVSFWEDFHSRDGVNHEWYFSSTRATEFMSDHLRKLDMKPTTVLHCGAGGFPAPVFGKLGDRTAMVTVNFDYASSCFSTASLDHETQVADVFQAPYRSHCFDIIYEKGLFDSVTSAGSATNAYKLLSEYYRLLSTVQGVAFIFSIFGPNAEQKDMMGLLCHEKLQVECHSLYVTPAEIPAQDFCFVYVVRAIE